MTITTTITCDGCGRHVYPGAFERVIVEEYDGHIRRDFCNYMCLVDWATPAADKLRDIKMNGRPLRTYSWAGYITGASDCHGVPRPPDAT